MSLGGMPKWVRSYGYYDSDSTLAGATSSAAYKRWERAAIAGVSLVADAAEHLERTTIDKKVSSDQGTVDESFPRQLLHINVQKGTDSVGKVLPPLPTLHQLVETNAQLSMKLKLQLFPVDEDTRRALEKDEHNPHLELTLSTRKKISSVLEHLNHKWGNSSIASGELMLFPYNIEKENLTGYQRWTRDTVASAADVYAIIGSPAIFRLRYGWFTSTKLGPVTLQAPSTSLRIQKEHASTDISRGKEQNADVISIPTPSGHPSEQLMESSKEQLTSITEGPAFISSYPDLAEDVIQYIGLVPENNFLESSDHTANSPWLRKDLGDGIIRRQWEDVDNLRTSNGTTLSAGEWADSLTNISIGDLLSEASRGMDSNTINPPTVESSQCLQQMPFSCDSFDAAIAAHISGYRDKPGLLSAQVSLASSIWDAEETCDAFSFQKTSALNHEVPSQSVGTSMEAHERIPRSNSLVFRGLAEELPEEGPTDASTCEGDAMDNCQSDTHSPVDSAKDLTGLTDIYWPDSLGPLDLDIPTSRYHGQDLLFGDSISLSGLNRLIATSLDAFQNCSFFGLDKKEPSTPSEACTPAPLSDFKVGGEG